jgi:glutaredoxin 3
MKAEIYSKTTCPYCTRAKALLSKLNVPYVEYVIGANASQLSANQQAVSRDHLLERLPTAKTVPQIWINGIHVGGCDELYAAHASGQLKKILTSTT